MSAQKKILIKITEWMLKIAILIYVFSFFFEIMRGINFEIDFWNGFTKIVLLVIFLIIAIVLLSLERENYETFGFFLVFIGALYKIFYSLFVQGIITELGVNILLIAVSFYFITKPIRNKRKQIHTF